MQKKKLRKQVVICGVTDSNNKAVKLTEKQMKEFVNGCSNNGEYNVIYIDK